MVIAASLLGQGQLLQVRSRQRAVVDLDHNTPPTPAAKPTLCRPHRILTISLVDHVRSKKAAPYFAETIHVPFDAGAKRLLLPMPSVKDIPTIPGELFAKFQTSFYSDPSDAVFKALGVE